jgi:hypothetical protein
MSIVRYPKRLAIPDNVRIRGGNLTIEANVGGWDHFWGANYNWAGWIKPQIDAATVLGANCIRIIGGPTTIIQGATTRAVYLARQKQFIEYCLNQGVYVYGCAGDWIQYSFWTSDWNGAVKDEMVAYAAFLHNYPNIIGIDVNQEGFYGRPSGWTDQQIHDQNQLWFTAIRAVTDIPLTCSQPTPNIPDVTEWADSVNIKKMAAYADYLDFHVYYDAVLSDTVQAFADAPLQFLIGETGANIGMGSSAMAARYTAIKNLLDTGRFRGALQWSIGNQDTTPSGDYGMYDSSFVPRTYVTDVFQTWTKTAPSMSDFLKDTFRGVSGTLMSAHAIDYGATYLNYGGDPFMDGSNRAKTNPGAIGYSVYSCTPPSADYDLEIPITFLNVNTDQDFNVSSRIRVNGDRYVIVGYYNTGVFTLGLVCWVNGGATIIGTDVPFNSIGAPLTAGGTYVFRLRCNGTTITGFKDGTQFATGTNSQIPEAGWVGFEFAGANTPTTGVRIGSVRAFPIGGGSAPLSIASPTVGTVTSSSIQMLASAAAGGIPGYAYQWYRNNVLIGGATALTLNDSGLSASTSYSYKIVATDASSATATSAPVSQTTSGGGGGGGVLIGNRFYEFDANLKTFVYVQAGVCT